MADLISSLPDEIIFYILYFLPSQQVVARSVLSKRWNLMWRYVPSLDFNTIDEDFWLHNCQKIVKTFYSSVGSFLVCRGDQPFHRFRLRCYPSMDITKSIKTRIQTALRGSCSVQILDLYCHPKDFVIPSVVFSFKTLVTLKLKWLTVEDMSFVDLPLLKILHLKYIFSLVEIDLSHIFSGCPNLEKLKVSNLACEAKAKIIRLPKLVKASIYKLLLPLEIFKEVEVLKLDWIFQPNLYLNFDFHNLVQLQLTVALDWLLVLKVLNHCPKLRSLVICINKIDVRIYQSLNIPGYEDVWPYLQTVPACISSHLKTFCLTHYSAFSSASTRIFAAIGPSFSVADHPLQPRHPLSSVAPSSAAARSSAVAPASAAAPSSAATPSLLPRVCMYSLKVFRVAILGCLSRSSRMGCPCCNVELSELQFRAI
ncbi:F-box protein At4g09920-like [Vigna radiata var. radiata]|uniref:F-box protein At4g09920-like n=1 Tax=Vigna radiata var. radiata TaxID=3916 RepID=A0A1S3U0D0_VIGRR|nr:F-box protein At4g09920-like [Vigna radiata var. radiata]